MTHRLPVCFGFPILFLLLVGCGGEGYPDVSGRITANGQPLSSVQVIFTPLVQDNNHYPGPWSAGVTDDGGRYTLKARRGETGACPGKHRVSFDWTDIESDELANLKIQLRELKGDGAEATRISSRIKEIQKKLASRPRGISKKTFEVTVTAEGASQVDFELAGQK